jgi:hypothetical protein
MAGKDRSAFGGRRSPISLVPRTRAPPRARVRRAGPEAVRALRSTRGSVAGAPRPTRCNELTSASAWACICRASRSAVSRRSSAYLFASAAARAGLLVGSARVTLCRDSPPRRGSISSRRSSRSSSSRIPTFTARRRPVISSGQSDRNGLAVPSSNLGAPPE